MMGHLFSAPFLLLAVCAPALGDAASDERELRQLVKDIQAAVLKVDMVFLERVLHKDYVHTPPNGIVQTQAQYLADRKSRRLKFDSLDSGWIAGHSRNSRRQHAARGRGRM